MSDSLIKLREIITNTDDIFTRINASEIEAAHKIQEDLGIDSLGLVNLFYEISDELGTDDDEELAASWKSVADILNYMDANLS
ncbi:acyl carrier protein [Bacteriovorax sp. DB6_IX]|uniref:acyl carrier protein n=1 Tax=Bacteriovorax sp. DB6_IX TaxID=1353530 RepID=UPI000389F84C|nr:phosphopantetheine-binding protein [Bacteriovorax sp. DB6_IX]EQC50677.1 putative acyl carrier protein [Bacteriovorax sp. DB6_IX]